MDETCSIENPDVAAVFADYPEPIRRKMLRLRQLVLETAAETEGVGALEETLKWGEPSYLTKGGSTIRMDWKEKSPHQCALYFNCNTSLVDTFKVLYGDVFTFEGNKGDCVRRCRRASSEGSEALCLPGSALSSPETPAIARCMTAPRKTPGSCL